MSDKSVLARLGLVAVLCWAATGALDPASASASAAAKGQAARGQAAPAFDGDAALAKSQDAAGNIVSGIHLTDPQGGRVDLEVLRGKPLIINMIYTSCAHFCGVLARNLIEAVDTANDILGEKAFNVVSVGFDTASDTPARMRQWGKSQGIDFGNWRMLAGDALNVRRLADAVGFTWAPSPIGFDHLAQVTIVDADGRVAYQVYGSGFDPPILIEPLKRITLGKTLSLTSMDGLANRVRLFCTVYDPKTGRYEFDYSILISIVIGTLILGTVGGIVVRAWLRESRRHYLA